MEHMNYRLAHQLVSAAKVKSTELLEIDLLEYNIDLLNVPGYVAGKARKLTGRSSRVYGRLPQLT